MLLDARVLTTDMGDSNIKKTKIKLLEMKNTVPEMKNTLGWIKNRLVIIEKISELEDIRSDQIRSVAQSCLTLCDPMNHSTPGLPVHH